MKKNKIWTDQERIQARMRWMGLTKLYFQIQKGRKKINEQNGQNIFGRPRRMGND